MSIPSELGISSVAGTFVGFRQEGQTPSIIVNLFGKNKTVPVTATEGLDPDKIMHGEYPLEVPDNLEVTLKAGNPVAVRLLNQKTLIPVGIV